MDRGVFMEARQNGPFRALAPLVLASGSPRRREFLAALGLTFEVVPSRVPEPRPRPGEEPASYAMGLAQAKASEVAARRPGAVVLGADTVVVLGDEILGKPEDETDAVGMLTRLAGQRHAVVTGCAVLAPDGRERVFSVATGVLMAASSPEALRAYVATGEPADKAGAYAIQGIGGFLVERIEGSYSNVVGLPVPDVLRVLTQWGIVAPL